jgi:hypothetical protein
MDAMMNAQQITAAPFYFSISPSAKHCRFILPHLVNAMHCLCFRYSPLGRAFIASYAARAMMPRNARSSFMMPSNESVMRRLMKNATHRFIPRHDISKK